MRANPIRINYAAKLREVIDRHNSGAANIEAFFEELKELAASLTEEEERHVREELTEEELAVFDLLTKPDPTLTKAQEAQVKKLVQELLEKLKHELLVLDWRKRQTTRAAVQVTIESVLDEGLPDGLRPSPLLPQGWLGIRACVSRPTKETAGASTRWLPEREHEDREYTCIVC